MTYTKQTRSLPVVDKHNQQNDKNKKILSSIYHGFNNLFIKLQRLNSVVIQPKPEEKEKK